MNGETKTIGEGLLSVKRLAVLLDLSVRQIWRLVAARQFPSPVYIGHAARWRWSEVEEYLEQQKRRRIV
jgi:predicted DNA-binding transcriptional regulator AlpA